MKFLYLFTFSLAFIIVSGQSVAPEVVVQTGHSSEVLDAKLSKGGKYIISAGADKRVVIWDRSLQKQFRTIDFHTNEVTSIVLHPYERELFYSASKDGTVRLNNLVSGESELVLDIGSAINKMMYLPSTERFVIGTVGILLYDKEFKLIDAYDVLEKQGYLDAMGGAQSLIYDFDVSNDEKSCVITDAAGKSVVFEFSGKDVMFRMQKKSIEKVCFNQRGNKVFQCYTDRQLKISVPNTIYSKPILVRDFSMKSALCSEGDWFYVGTGNGNIIKVNGSLFWTSKIKKLTNYKVTSIQFSSELGLLVVADMVGKIYLVNAEDFSLLETYESKVKVISDYEFEESKKKVAVAFRDNTIEVFDIATLESTVNVELMSKKFSKRYKTEVVNVAWQNEDVLITYLKKKTSMEVRDRFDYVKEYQVTWDLSENKLVNKSVVDEPEFASKCDQGLCSYGLPNESLTGVIDYKKNGIRLYLFDNHQFVLFNENDQYYSSKDGIKNIGFRLDNQLYSFEQFDLIYNRPDQIFKAFEEELGQQLVESYNLAYQKRISRLGFDPEKIVLDSHDVPILEAEVDKKGEQCFLKLGWDAKKKSNPKLHVYVNGVPIYGTQGLVVSNSNKDSVINFSMEHGKNTITSYISSGTGLKSLRNEALVELKGDNQKRDLYLVTIGCSRYLQAQYDLDYASKDAKDVASFLSKSKIYENSHVLTLTDEEVTKDAIAKISSFISPARIEDVVIVYIAGHGVLSVDYDLYLASHDMDFEKPTQKGIPYASVENVLENAKSRHKCLFLDACHSGEIDKEEVELAQSANTIEDGEVNFRSFSNGININEQNSFQLSKTLFADMQPNHGITIVSSAGGSEYALEGSKWKNGVFTYSFLNGISGGFADLNGDGRIMLSEVTKYVLNNVVKLTKGAQNPTSRIENIYNDIQIF